MCERGLYIRPPAAVGTTTAAVASTSPTSSQFNTTPPYNIQQSRVVSNIYVHSPNKTVTRTDIKIQVGKQTDKQTNKQTNRQTYKYGKKFSLQLAYTLIIMLNYKDGHSIIQTFPCTMGRRLIVDLSTHSGSATCFKLLAK